MINTAMTAWHWVVGLATGWIPIGIAIVAWILWFICPRVAGLSKVLPYKTQLLHIAEIATVFAFTSLFYFSDGYKKGRADVMSSVERINKGVSNEIAKRNQSIDACHDANWYWDQSERVCRPTE